MTGMWLGIHAAARIDRLVLANTAARIAPADLWNQRIEKVNAGGIAAISDAVLARWFTPEFRRARAETLARDEGDDGAAAARGLRRVLRGRARHGPARDGVAHRGADARHHRDARRVDPARRRRVPRGSRSRAPASSSLPAAHLSNIEAAPAFNAALASFLEER